LYESKKKHFNIFFNLYTIIATMKQNNPPKETIKEIAKRCNITEQTYYNWKKNKPELIKLINMGLDLEKTLAKYNK